MAENNSVGALSISLDLEADKGLDAQVEKVGKGISKKLSESIDTKLNPFDFSKMISSMENFTSKIENSFDKLTDKVAQGMKKLDEISSKTSTKMKEDAAKVTATPKATEVPKPTVVQPTTRVKSNPIVQPTQLSNSYEVTQQKITDKYSALRANVENDIAKKEELAAIMDQKIRELQSKYYEIDADYEKGRPMVGKSMDQTLEVLGKLDTKIDESIVKHTTFGREIEQLELKLKSLDSQKAVEELSNYEVYLKKTEQASKKLKDETVGLTKSLDKPKGAKEPLKENYSKDFNSNNRGNSNLPKVKPIDYSPMNKGLSNYSDNVGKATKRMSMFKSAGRSMARNLLGLGLMISLTASLVRKLASSLWQSLTSNNEFSNSLNQIKSNLATAFQPIYEAILPALNALMRALATVTSYIATFVSWLFGKSVKASSAGAAALQKQTEAMNGYAAAATEAQKVIAGFDQVNDISEQDDAGGGGKGGAVHQDINIDDGEVTAFERLLNRIKDAMLKAFDSAPVKAFMRFMKVFVREFSNMFKEVGKTIFENIADIWTLMLPNIRSGLSNISSLFTNVFNSMVDSLEKWMPKITEKLVTFVNNFYNTFAPLYLFISQLFKDITQIILDIWNQYGAPILDEFGKFIDGMIDTFNKIWTHIIDPIVRPAIEMLKKLWDDHLKDMLKEIGDFIGHVILEGLKFYNEFIKPMIDAFIEQLEPVIRWIANTVFPLLGDVFGSVVITIRGLIASLKSLFDGILTFLEGVFTGNWRMVWQGVKDIFSSIISGLANIFKLPINFIIDGINGFLRGLNNIKIPDWVPVVGGKGFDIPSIPKLASGGILKEPTLNIAGEYPGASSNPEIVTPESLMADTFRKVMAEYGTSREPNDSNKPIYLTINLAGKKFFQEILNLAEEYKKQTGQEVIIVG